MKAAERKHGKEVIYKKGFIIRYARKRRKSDKRKKS